MGAAHNDLRSLGCLANLNNVCLQACCVYILLVSNLLCLRHEGFHLAQVKQGIASVGLLDNSRHNVAFATGVLVVLHVALNFANALLHDLLGCLCGNAAKVSRCVIPLANDVAVNVKLLSVHPDLTIFWVNGDHGLFGGIWATLVGSYQRVGQGIEQGLNRDALL